MLDGIAWSPWRNVLIFQSNPVLLGLCGSLMRVRRRRSLPPEPHSTPPPTHPTTVADEHFYAAAIGPHGITLVDNCCSTCYTGSLPFTRPSFRLACLQRE